MKKALILLTVFALCLGLWACGVQDPDPTTTVPSIQPSEPDDPADHAARIAQFQELLTNDYWINQALQQEFASPSGLSEMDLFRNGFPDAGGWDTFTEEEAQYLLDQGFDRDLDVQKMPSSQISEVLRQYFNRGVNIDRTQFNWEYYDGSYYSNHNVNQPMLTPQVTDVSDAEYGEVLIHYTVDGQNRLLKLRPNGAGSYYIISNRFNDGEPLPLPENYTVEDLVTTSYAMGKDFELPCIYYFSQDAYDLSMSLREYYSEWSLYDSISYRATLHNDVLRITISPIYYGEVMPESMYFLDMITGELMDTAAMVERYMEDMSYLQFIMMSKDFAQYELSNRFRQFIDSRSEYLNALSNLEHLSGADLPYLYATGSGRLYLRYHLPFYLTLYIGYEQTERLPLNNFEWNKSNAEAYTWFFDICPNIGSTNYAQVLFTTFYDDPEDFLEYLALAEEGDRTYVIRTFISYCIDYRPESIRTILADLRDSDDLSSTALDIAAEILDGLDVQDQPMTPQITPLTDELRQEVEDAYLRETGVELTWTEDPQSYWGGNSARYCGTFGDCVILYCGPVSDFVTVESNIAGVIFPGYSAYEIRVYHDGSFIELGDAYNTGLLSVLDIHTIAANYICYDYMNLEPLPESVEQAIKEAYLEQNAQHADGITADDLTVRYFGSNGNTHAVMVDGLFAYDPVVTRDPFYITYEFLYPTSQPLLLFHEGSLYSLQEAYEHSIISVYPYVYYNMLSSAFPDLYY